MPIINREDKTASQAFSRLFNPSARFQTRFSLLGLAKLDALLLEVKRDLRIRERTDFLAKRFAVRAGVDFAEPAFLHKNAMHGKSIEEFIGKDAANRNVRRQFGSRCKMSGFDVRLECGPMSF